MFGSIAFIAIVAATSVGSACAALFIVSSVAARKDGRPRLADLPAGTEPAVYLFEGRELVDATGPALHLLGPGGSAGQEWARLMAYLVPRFAGVENALESLAETGPVEMAGRDDPALRLQAEYLSGLVRLTLSDLRAEGMGVVVDGLSQRAQEEELQTLRDIASGMPVAAWRQRPDGTIDWANSAYLDLLAEQSGVSACDLSWPFAAVFGAMRPAEANIGTGRLATPETGGRGPRWFDHRQMHSPQGTLHFAVAADGQVRAESNLKEFVQTLTKTFAHLPIGLMVCDRQRRLTMFNPALVDLTGLPPEFLLAKPTLLAVLDRLREMRMVPEPKDYQAWRKQMAELERAAAAGFHQETWSLAGGQTFRVTGRPHPDGAVAFLLEDISAEISLTRRFRAEIELGQEVINAIDEAMAVFSTAGVLIQSNAAYARLWGIDPGAALKAVTIRESVRHWQAMTLPDGPWADVLDLVSGAGPRRPMQAAVTQKDNTVLRCRCVPLTGGATLVGFCRAGAEPEPRRALRVRRMAAVAEEA